MYVLLTLTAETDKLKNHKNTLVFVKVEKRCAKTVIKVFKLYLLLKRFISCFLIYLNKLITCIEKIYSYNNCILSFYTLCISMDFFV
jgi:hypothetical protein